MQLSDYFSVIGNTLKVLFIILLTTPGVIWLNQKSLENYWALHFHREAPWVHISSPLWKEGARIMLAVQGAKDTFIGQYFSHSRKMVLYKTDENISRNEQQVSLFIAGSHDYVPQNELQLSKLIVTGRRHNEMNTRKQSHVEPLYDMAGQAMLSGKKKVLFIGDSMMEGVAPRVIKLLGKYNITGINLSKRSTGLAYPGFFNWPKTTADVLKDDPAVGLLIVFMGPNDPWDMPSEQGKYLKFGSLPWQDEYRGRIRKILSLSRQYEIPVIWLLPPNMHKEKLNQGVNLINKLYESEVTDADGIVIRVNDVFGYQGMDYSPGTIINQRSRTVRAGDGIHFTSSGADMIARAIMKRIHVIPEERENNNDL
ncbi:DUF459 domain-containing protein [Escherichia sp. 14.0985]|uniref:SGNH/GDSL hydrolase family protein n=1 Tax=Escherichia sp. 14.0985 TaxID=2723301 RepID=UPI001594CD16|nr:DUF459 domain-containing protein [Escherichia sp. 14.0985]MBB2411885.1 DUF459 domain-containing protein [Escherichia sp. 14.0985]